MAKLEVRNLTISFRTGSGAVRAVRDISFDLNAGETLAIAGESGSGKSVTTRAVMGILAGNAMVDGGEIIYDGRDLLKIPEEEFHTLRGHKLAMVFQDPLSALNPIMRIGDQLTEAMLLNNKERRRDGRKRFNDTLEQLKKAMIAAKGESAREDIERKVRHFDKLNVSGIELQNRYNAAREAAVEAMDCIEACDSALLRRDAKAVGEAVLRLAACLKSAANPYLLPGKDGALSEASQALKPYGKGFSMREEAALREHLEKLRTLLSNALAGEQPDFFCIGYTALTGCAADPTQTPIEQINREAKEKLDEEFLADFLRDVEAALCYSHAQSRRAAKHAEEALKKEAPVFDRKTLDHGACSAAIRRASGAVQAAIDPLRLEKDSQAWVFRSSMNAELRRYFLAKKNDPKEEKRFEKDTRKREKLLQKGRFAPAVPPKNLMNAEASRRRMQQTLEALRRHFAEEKDENVDFALRASEMIDFLKDRAADYANRLTKGMAKHRALELMKEVGIPEPRKRFHQYPFEFSGGMRQRIVIAIALSANPDVLICDEPTTALDVTIQAQILELINRLKKERKLSVIFITHDLGVVANMADRIAIMYAGKIVEYGTADEVFYDPRHPYTWALLSSLPDLETTEKLDAIPGTPPNMILPPKGDAFAARNRYAMQIDFEQQPPMFQVSPTHSAATWLLHPDAPKVTPPAIVTERIERMRRKEAEGGAKA